MAKKKQKMMVKIVALLALVGMILTSAAMFFIR